MIKKLILLFLASVLAFGADTGRVMLTITITSGTPTEIATSVTMADRILIQMKHGGTGLGYVFDGIPNGSSAPVIGTTPAIELAPASSTSPGGAYNDSSALGIDVSQIWVDGSHTGDTVVVSYYKRHF